MDYGTVVQLIGSLGFPIVMCLLLYKRMDKEDERHREEMEALRETLNNNTLAINNLSTKLEQKGAI